MIHKSHWQSIYMEKSWLNLCICVYLTEHGEKEKKGKDLSEDLRTKIVSFPQSQGYKSISRDLNITVSTVSLINVQPIALWPISLETDGRENVIEECNKGSFAWWIENLSQLLNKFKLTCRHRVQNLSLHYPLLSEWNGTLWLETQDEHC